ncbi:MULTISPECIES: hypothetical protein [Bosea]|uniref:Uncharacterized protein n=2 Tax=Bosea TaxID=85413 RepID=A0A927I1A7_9HYPH|nr:MULTISPECIES: hypothetical protein [Bosea]MBD3847376.1 hypothetical protein [Bosea spartocytisi]MCP4549362.1 hypothetical protein [bacterium]MCT4475284.1 hypothetical protein [Bosea spartocytisi]
MNITPFADPAVAAPARGRRVDLTPVPVSDRLHAGQDAPARELVAQESAPARAAKSLNRISLWIDFEV